METTSQSWPWLEPRMPCGMLEAATTSLSQPPQLSPVEAPVLLVGRQATERMAMPIPKVAILSAPNSFIFKIRAIACANFTNFTTSMGTKHKCAFSYVPGWKTKAPPNPYRFGGKFSTCHSHAFPGKCRPNFSHGQVD